MKIELWTIEKPKKNEFSPMIANYAKRIKRYTSFDLRSIDNSKIPTNKSSIEEIKRKEGEGVLKQLDKTDFLVLLDERGKEMRSVQFAEQINQWQLSNKNNVVILIAGSYGPSDAIRQRANATLSLSQLTLPHRIVKLLSCEQIYRAFSILNGEKYHHD